MLSGSFPIFALSNHTTFSQTQSGATVPLKISYAPSIKWPPHSLPIKAVVRIPQMKYGLKKNSQDLGKICDLRIFTTGKFASAEVKSYMVPPSTVRTVHVIEATGVNIRTASSLKV
jgi:hypothetical protein